MKKVLMSAAVASAFAVALSAMPQERPQNPSDPQKSSPSSVQNQATAMQGSITSIDSTNKSFVMKDEASGKEVTVFWDSSTKVTGDLKVGSAVSLQTTDQGGRTVATSIDAKASSPKKPY
jgi:hypothetical protein